MMDDGGLQWLMEHVQKFAHEAPAVRREKIIELAVGGMREGPKKAAVRILVRMMYEKLFPTEQDVCEECGLNDGHHHAGCRLAGDVRPQASGLRREP